MPAYFLITCGEDGINIEALSESALLARIEPDKHGDYYYGEDLKFSTKIPDIDKGCWREENTALLIRGDVVVPTPEKVSVKYKL